MKQAARKDFVEAFARGLEVIKAFDELHPVLGISEVAERANLARPTAHRFLLTLEELGYVRSTPAGYMLTPKIVDLGMAYISSTNIFKLAQPRMEKLARELDQTCSLTQLDGSDVVYVARVTVPKIIRLAVTVGGRLPAFGTAMGDVLLADLDDEQIEEVVATPSLSTFVPAQQCTREQLLKQIDFARQNGYSISDERLSYGIRAIAVPIRTHEGKVHSSLGMATHADSATVEQLKTKFLPPLLDAAAAISKDWEHFASLPNVNIPSLTNTVPAPYPSQLSL
jgi:IclR family transcriptional regulator, pca regulon regulatory protein